MGSVPLLPSLPTAAQPRRGSSKGRHQLGCTWREICAETGRHTQRRRHAAHTTHTGMDSTAPGARVSTLRDGDTVIPNTHTHARTDAAGAIWTHQDLNMQTSGPPRQPGWGQLCNPYGVQTQLSCPRVWLWGGARASVSGKGLSVSKGSPPSEDTYHTPQ